MDNPKPEQIQDKVEYSVATYCGRRRGEAVARSEVDCLLRRAILESGYSYTEVPK